MLFTFLKFLFLVWLHCLEPPAHCGTEGVRAANLALFLVLGRNHLVSHHYGLPHLWLFFRWGWRSSFPILICSVIIWTVDKTVTHFLCVCIYWEITWFFFLVASRVNNTDCFLNVRLTLHSWNKPHLVMMHYIFKIKCCIQFPTMC